MLRDVIYMRRMMADIGNIISAIELHFPSPSSPNLENINNPKKREIKMK